MWQQDYEQIYNIVRDAYQKSDEYFGSVCNPIAKRLKLYDIYGIDTANGVICGNTILCHYYSPSFSYNGENGEYIKSMAEIGGTYIRLFYATDEFRVNNTIIFDVQDYGGFKKSLVGKIFSDKFVLMSILCQINFLLYGVEMWIEDEIPAKLRFGYLLYYSLTNIIDQINEKIGTHFNMKQDMKSDTFRNAMAHYKLGIALKQHELLFDDAMFGLTIKIFGKEYSDVKKEIYKVLDGLAKQIGEYLELPHGMVSLK